MWGNKSTPGFVSLLPCLSLSPLGWLAMSVPPSLSVAGAAVWQQADTSNNNKQSCTAAALSRAQTHQQQQLNVAVPSGVPWPDSPPYMLDPRLGRFSAATSSAGGRRPTSVAMMAKSLGCGGGYGGLGIGIGIRGGGGSCCGGESMTSRSSSPVTAGGTSEGGGSNWYAPSTSSWATSAMLSTNECGCPNEDDAK